MHISEGVLSAPVLIAGAAASVACVGVGLKKMNYDEVPRVAVLSSAFFIASLIHIPIGPASAHLILNGIVGLLLGWTAFPAILLALALQAVLFQFGGVTTLGINTFNMAMPAVLIYYCFRGGIRSQNRWIMTVSAFCAGSLSVLLSGIIVAASLVTTGEVFVAVGKVIICAHIPVIITEGLLTVFCIGFLRKVKSEMLDSSRKGA
ncbi:MAG: cobalt transporter CbiM [Deltaproteobacteria bacterium]|jgi:cobalt/nickel transport system permease protein|nr:cobalt transporter CbiM [Desulfobacterales bacterium]MDL1975449.1 cobalt transporter CbiM [Deltaproteobacteria bacterium]